MDPFHLTATTSIAEVDLEEESILHSDIDDNIDDDDDYLTTSSKKKKKSNKARSNSKKSSASTSTINNSNNKRTRPATTASDRNNNATTTNNKRAKTSLTATTSAIPSHVTASSTNSTSPPPNQPAPIPTREDRARQRKVSHSAIEKRRRERINDKITQLRQMVPRACLEAALLAYPSSNAQSGMPLNAGLSASAPPHKLSVLQGAIFYIQHLHALIQSHPLQIPPFTTDNVHVDEEGDDHMLGVSVAADNEQHQHQQSSHLHVSHHHPHTTTNSTPSPAHVPVVLIAAAAPSSMSPPPLPFHVKMEQQQVVHHVERTQAVDHHLTAPNPDTANTFPFTSSSLSITPSVSAHESNGASMTMMPNPATTTGTVPPLPPPPLTHPLTHARTPSRKKPAAIHIPRTHSTPILPKPIATATAASQFQNQGDYAAPPPSQPQQPFLPLSMSNSTAALTLPPPPPPPRHHHPITTNNNSNYMVLPPTPPSVNSTSNNTNISQFSPHHHQYFPSPSSASLSRNQASGGVGGASGPFNSGSMPHLPFPGSSSRHNSANKVSIATTAGNWGHQPSAAAVTATVPLSSTGMSPITTRFSFQMPYQHSHFNEQQQPQQQQQELQNQTSSAAISIRLTPPSLPSSSSTSVSDPSSPPPAPPATMHQDMMMIPTMKMLANNPFGHHYPHVYQHQHGAVVYHPHQSPRHHYQQQYQQQEHQINHNNIHTQFADSATTSSSTLTPTTTTAKMTTTVTDHPLTALMDLASARPRIPLMANSETTTAGGTLISSVSSRTSPSFSSTSSSSPGLSGNATNSTTNNNTTAAAGNTTPGMSLAAILC